MAWDPSPEKALLFRITHIANVPAILELGGLICASSPRTAPGFVNIGSTELIDKRSKRVVPVPPGGTLSDYVPFYFTPFSPMMYKIKTGHGGITQRQNSEIVIFVTSVPKLVERQIVFLFTNQHAYSADTIYFDSPTQLDKIDWALLRSRNFKTDDSDPGKSLRYQAEALIHRHVPLDAIFGIGCYDESAKAALDTKLRAASAEIDVKITPRWYF